jgi:DNA topoisomerase-1
VYASKVKNAQEAHEAIRPAGDSFRTPAQTGLTGDEFRLYELIWMRTIASQMKDAVGQSVSVRLGGAARSGEDVVFAASGRVITFHGFLKAYVEGRDDESSADDQETRLPNVAEGDAVNAASLRAAGHQTKPPARYTEATLIKELEDREIGRPRRTPRSSARSSTAATSTRRAPRWCRPGWRSRWCGCSRSTSPGWCPTSSPR